MPVYDVAGLGRTLRVVAPAPGEFDPVAWRAFTAGTDLHGLDVESTHLTPRGVFDPAWRLRLIQFGSADTGWVLDVTDPAQEAAAAELLADPAHHFVSHTPIDVKAVWSHFRVSLGQRVLDTHLLSKIINPDELAGHALKELTVRYLDGVLQEGEAALHAWFETHGQGRGPKQRQAWGWDHIPSGEPVYAVYAGLDAIYCRALLPCLLAECREVPHIVHFEHWLAAQCTGVTLRGLRLDLEYTRRVLAELEQELNAADALITRRLGFPARSPRFPEWVETRGPVPAGLGRTEKTHRLQVTASIDGITQVAPALMKAAEKWSPEDRELLAARDVVAHRANTVTNVRKFLECADPAGYVHPDMNTLRARTARMSVTDPPLQTLRKPSDKDPGSGRLRHCFMADPGHVLISCDFDQVEVRVTAALSRDPRLLGTILAREDVHDTTARALYGPDFSKAQRNIGKRATFGTIYGGGADALASQTGVPVGEAAALIKRWRRAYPKVSLYAKRVARQDPVITATGRRIPADRLRKYANINYAVQSGSRDLLMQAVYNILTRHGLAHTLWLMVHDEVILHAPEQDAGRVCEIMAREMSFSFRGVPITASPEVLGTHWGKLPEDPPAVAAA